MRVCIHGCDVSDLYVFFKNYLIKAIEHFSVFTEPPLNTQRVGRILESYVNPGRLGFA